MSVQNTAGVGWFRALLLPSFVYKDRSQPEFTEYRHDFLCSSAPRSKNKWGCCLWGSIFEPGGRVELS
ncbi:hypothetical protein ACHQM5_009981 [Ranunculus cassubicifolius]